jgi:hypothetical protein
LGKAVLLFTVLRGPGLLASLHTVSFPPSAVPSNPSLCLLQLEDFRALSPQQRLMAKPTTIYQASWAWGSSAPAALGGEQGWISWVEAAVASATAGAPSTHCLHSPAVCHVTCATPPSAGCRARGCQRAVCILPAF